MKPTIYVDSSTLSAVADCSTLAVGQYHLGLTSPEESLAPIRGRAIHEAIGAHLAGVPPEQALKLFDEAYQTLAEERGATGRESHANLRQILASWVRQNPVERLPFVPIPGTVELAFQEPLWTGPTYDLVYTGRLDLLARHEDGGLYVVDVKTTGWWVQEWIEQWSTSPQLSGYLWAAERALERLKLSEPILGALIVALQIVDLPRSERKCRDHGVTYSECSDLHFKHGILGPYQRTPERLREWKRTAIHLGRRWADTLLTVGDGLDALTRTRTQGEWTGRCSKYGGCTFRGWCLQGRPVDALERQFVVRKWDVKNARPMED